MSTNEKKKRGLGRGLSALMSDVQLDAQAGASQSRDEVRTLPIEWIEPNPDQPRKTFEPQDMADLVASIATKGVLQPLIVRELGPSNFQIVAGERRWRAAQQANLHELPVLVRDFSDTEVIEVAIIENIQRADLNPMEEAAGYKSLMDQFDHTQEQMAEALGKSRSHIANLLRLLTLPDSIQNLVIEGKLSSGHARALITANDPETLAQRVVREQLSVRALEALLKSEKSVAKEPQGASKRTPPTKDADTKALEGDLSATLGMRVELSHSQTGEGGELKIRYKSLDQLDDLCRLLGGM